MCSPVTCSAANAQFDHSTLTPRSKIVFKAPPFSQSSFGQTDVCFQERNVKNLCLFFPLPSAYLFWLQAFSLSLSLFSPSPLIFPLLLVFSPHHYSHSETQLGLRKWTCVSIFRSREGGHAKSELEGKGESERVREEEEEINLCFCLASAQRQWMPESSIVGTKTQDTK